MKEGGEEKEKTKRNETRQDKEGIMSVLLTQLITLTSAPFSMRKAVIVVCPLCAADIKQE